MDFDERGNLIKNKCFYTLKEACKLKGLCLKTAYNNKNFQPNKGTPDAYIGGRMMWSYETINSWLAQSDKKE